MGKRRTAAPADEQPADGAPVDEDQGDDEPAGGDGSSPASSSTPAPSAVDDGAGWVLGLLLWGWVVLPFFKGGPAEVKKTLKAKFLNKAPDGSALP